MICVRCTRYGKGFSCNTDLGPVPGWRSRRSSEGDGPLELSALSLSCARTMQRSLQARPVQPVVRPWSRLVCSNGASRANGKVEGLSVNAGGFRKRRERHSPRRRSMRGESKGEKDRLWERCPCWLDGWTDLAPRGYAGRVRWAGMLGGYWSPKPRWMQWMRGTRRRQCRKATFVR
jgi:hypothetical protein